MHFIFLPRESGDGLLFFGQIRSCLRKNQLLLKFFRRKFDFLSRKYAAINHLFVGTDYPTGCISFWGPHSLECYRTIWSKTGCVAESAANPVVNPIRRTALDRLNLA